MIADALLRFAQREQRDRACGRTATHASVQPLFAATWRLLPSLGADALGFIVGTGRRVVRRSSSCGWETPAVGLVTSWRDVSSR